MEKDIDRIAKNADTDIVIRIDDFGGKRGITIREFVKSERYTGFTKSGLRIPSDKFSIFKKAINSIDEKDLVEEEKIQQEYEQKQVISEYKEKKIQKDKQRSLVKENIVEKEF